MLCILSLLNSNYYIVNCFFPTEFKEASGKRSVQSLIVKTEMLGNMPCEAQDKVR